MFDLLVKNDRTDASGHVYCVSLWRKEICSHDTIITRLWKIYRKSKIKLNQFSKPLISLLVKAVQKMSALRWNTRSRMNCNSWPSFIEFIQLRICVDALLVIITVVCILFLKLSVTITVFQHHRNSQRSGTATDKPVQTCSSNKIK